MNLNLNLLNYVTSYRQVFLYQLLPAAPRHPVLLCCSTSGSPGVTNQREVYLEFESVSAHTGTKVEFTSGSVIKNQTLLPVS